MMEKKYARLAALLAAAVICGNGAPSMADNIFGTKDNGWHTVIDRDYNDDVYGNPNNPDANGTVTGHVKMTGGTVTGQIFGGFADDAGDVKNSTVTITGGTVTRYVYGGQSDYGAVTGNTVKISGGTVTISVYGGQSDYGEVSDNTVTITSGSTVENSVYGGQSSSGEVSDNRVTITGGTVKNRVYGGYSWSAATGNTVTISGGTVGTVDSSSSVYGGWSSSGEVSDNTVTITGGTVSGDVYGGWSNGGAVTGNTVTISGGTVSGDVYGGCSGWGNTDVTGNTVTITGGTVSGDVYGGWSGEGAVVSDNTLVVGGGSSTVGDLRNFETIRFQGVTWDPGGTLLTIKNGAEGDLENTKIDAGSVSFAGGTELQTGDSMTFIKGDNLGIQEENVDVADTFTAGVAAVGTGEMSVDNGNISYTLTEVSRNTQTDLIAENRAVAAAFVNQGADIAADSLRLLDDGYHYGTQTFGAVYGNRSQYDVAGDIKINGWSEIAGFGNIHEVKGGRLAWGVFYENGTGNYRTWNTFNNEMFRGDGSLLYNGGGAAVRLTKDSGMYYEASLRAGTLSSSMSNAVKDGAGNSYGFNSDSTYWGAHVGAGKLIQRGSGQWDIYGKYFHTDIDGDSFEMGGDRFSFDSVTSDRLRLGARYIADTDKAWSLYCGAAYEYEFSGDSRMKAGQFEAPEQSLQGSTVFGEIGTVWGRKDSPWSMDVNLRGYAGEREGFSGMVQLAYAF